MSIGRFVAILVLVALVVGSASFAGVYYSLRNNNSRGSAATAPLPTSPGTGTPGTTAPPADPILSRIVVSQADVGSTVDVQLVPQGQSLSQPTLDVCNATYPSESLRTTRLQVETVDGQGNVGLSTEAVLYSSANATSQAFAELSAAASKCPSTPVPSPVGQQSVTTKFNAAPDGSWPQVASVQRVAFDFTSTDSTGQTQHSVAAYLRRGKVLLGVYFSQPDAPQASVAGQSTIPGIVNLFANRIAQLPASAVGA
jgi:hypothetical protein